MKIYRECETNMLFEIIQSPTCFPGNLHFPNHQVHLQDQQAKQAQEEGLVYEGSHVQNPAVVCVPNLKYCRVRVAQQCPPHVPS